MPTVLHSLSWSSFSRMNQRGCESEKRKDVSLVRRRAASPGRWKTLLGSSLLLWHHSWER